MNEKPKLPSIKDLLEGGPGLIDYTRPPIQQQHHHHQYHHKHPSSSVHHVHRRHASEHIISNKDRLVPPHPPHQPQHPLPLPAPPSNHNASLQLPPSMSKSSTMSLPMDMQQLSLEKKKPPETMRGRTHSRSYSDFIYPTNAKHTTLKEAEETAAHVKDKSSVEQEDDGEEEEDEYEEGEEETQVNISRSNSSCRYICPYCNKGFTRPSSLRTHTFSHTGEKPFVCSEPCCGRKFSVQSNLRRHLRIHRSNKPTTLFLSKNIH
ncbi:hypothetical protein PS15m_006989 [Mucor circinelloides]